MFLHRDTQRFFEVLGVERATQRRFTFLETRNEGDWEKRRWWIGTRMRRIRLGGARMITDFLGIQIRGIGIILKVCFTRLS